MGITPANRRKWNCVCGVVVVVFTLLLYRLFVIQIVGHASSVEERERQSSSIKENTVCRGMILDRRGDILALSREVYSVYAVPSEVEDAVAAADALAAALSLDRKGLLRLLTGVGEDGKPLPHEREFLWIKRRISESESRVLTERPLAGIHLKTEYRRFYPNGDLASHILGITDVDDRGLEGVERRMDTAMRDSRTVIPISVDGRRVPVLPEDGVAPIPLTSQGNNVMLTVDLRIQRIVEDAVDRGMAEWRPKSISAVVMDPRTGAILALTNRPTFEPQEAGRAHPSERRNRVIADPFEPGSTFKPVVISAALEEGICTPETKIDCEHGLWTINGRRLHDHHPYGILTVREIIAKSSNIGAAKIGHILLGEERMIRCVKNFGFGRKTGIELPREDAGSVKPDSQWSYYTTTSVPMGHEILVTPLQLVQAFAVFANGGSLVRPYLVSRVSDERGRVLSETSPIVVRRVIGPETAARVREMLVEVVESGTGTKAKIEGLRYGGKTGTTKKWDPEARAYTSERHISTFAAFAPSDDARLCLVVVVDEPKGGYYGGSVAAPIVAEIVKASLSIMN